MIPSIGRCTLHVSERTPHLVKGLQSCQRWGQSGSRFHQGGLSWALTQELHMTGLQVVDAALDLNLPCSNLRAECHAKLWIQRLGHTWDRRYQMHPNASKCPTVGVSKPHSKERCFCNWVSRARAVCTSQYVTICHNMSQHVMICHDMSRCHQHSTGLFSDEWAVLQKEVNGVEDVPCKRTDDARGSWVLQEILVPGISWILYYFHPKNISGHYRKIWGKTGVEAQIIYIPYWYTIYTILLMCNCFWCIPNHSKATAAELYRNAL